MQNKDFSKQAQNIASMVMQQNNNKPTFSDRLDQWVTHPILGLVIFAFVMWSVFSLSQVWIGPWLSDTLMIGLEAGVNAIASLIESYDVSVFWQGLIIEGILGGFIAVIGFLPLIMVLLFFLQLLEDSGYMARVALVFNHYFSHLRTIRSIHYSNVCWYSMQYSCHLIHQNN
jgi:ferrous iron transport protein B